MGPDGILGSPLVILKQDLSDPLQRLFNINLETGFVLDEWMIATVISLHKDGMSTNSSNYRPISLTNLICKVMERITMELIKLINKDMGNLQTVDLI